MEPRLDIVSNDAGELVRRERSRELGAEAVVAVYRLLRLARMHDTSNKAFVNQLEQTHAMVGEYGLRSDSNVNVLFAQRAVFVAGQLLKGSRQVYEAAEELGQMLDWCGGAELSIQRDVSAAELKAFAEAVAQGLRTEKADAFRSPTPKIRLRPVNDAALLRGLDVEDLAPEQKIVRTYATAVVIMRRLFEDLAAGRFALPRRVKRIAQKLVDLSEGTTPAFLGITEMRNANHDDAGRAVNGAILAVSMARQITENRTLLAQIAMAAMLHDVGRPRAQALASGGAPGMEGVQAFLTDESEDELAAGTAAVLTAVGRLNEATINRTVIAFEAQWLRRRQSLGATYRGVRPPTLQARMIAIARRYNDLLIPEPGMPPPPTDFAIATVWNELTDPADRVVIRLLASALRLFPVGSVVGLSTGEVGVVVPGGDRDAGPGRPRLRIVMDEEGAPVEPPLDVDLGHPEPDDPPREILKILSVEGWAKGLSLQPRADGEEVEEPEPLAWERAGVKPPSVSRVIPAPGDAPSPGRGRARTAPTAAAVKPGTRRPTGAIAPSFDAARAPAAAPAPRAPIAPAFEPPAAPPPPAASARQRATPPPGSERVTPSSRRVQVAPAVTPPPAAAARQRATPPPVSERVTPSSRRSPAAARPTPSPPLQAPRQTPPPAEGRPTRPEGPRVTPPSGLKHTAPKPERPVADGPPVKWGRRLDDFPAADRTEKPAEPRTRIAPGASAAVLQTEAVRLVPPDLVPSAHGTLGVTPLAHILVYMLDNRAAGCISFHEPDGWEHIVAVYEGSPSMVKTERPVALLGGVMASKAGLSRDTMLRAVEDARAAGLLFGEHLVRVGLVSREQLVEGLETQVIRKVASLANLPEGTRYAYYPGRNFLDGWAGGELFPADPLTVILEAVRGWMDRVRILGTLSRVGAQPLCLHPESDLSALQLTPEEQTVLDVIRDEGPLLAHLFDKQVADIEVVRSLVYMLAITRQFEFSRDRGAPMRSGRPVAPPRVPRKRSTGALQVTLPDPRVEERLDVSDAPGQIPVAVTPLPLTRDTEPAPMVGREFGAEDEDEETRDGSDAAANAAAIHAAALAEAQSWAAEPAEPSWSDETAAASEGEVVDDVDVEIVEDDFEGPGMARGAPAEAGSPAEQLLQAMSDFRLAQDALQKGDLAQAEAFAQGAVDGDPGNGEHLSLLAWIRAKDGAPEAVEDSLFMLDQVLDDEPELLRARLYRARLHKRAGRRAEALADFEVVLQINPRHREAAAEVKALR